MNRPIDWSELENPDRELVERAQEASAYAYAPYSLFAVGAAVRSRSGKIYAAANLENASSGLTICAEAAALSLANSAGDLDIDAIAVVGFNFMDSGGASRVVAPCGSCRQLIAEAAQLANGDVRVLCCSGELEQYRRLEDLRIIAERFWPREFGGEPGMARLARAIAHSRHRTHCDTQEALTKCMSSRKMAACLSIFARYSRFRIFLAEECGCRRGHLSHGSRSFCWCSSP